MSRRPPLHTLAASFLAIIHIACGKAEENNRAFKKLAQGLSIALPLVYAIQYQWLAILLFTDDWILELQKLSEIIFSPSTILFDKMDLIVSTAEMIPERLDDALNNGVPVNINQVDSFLEWALVQIIIRGLDLNLKEEEKEIMMDVNSSSVTTETSLAEAAAKAKAKDDDDDDDDNCPAVHEDQESVSEDNDKHTVELSGIDESGYQSLSGIDESRYQSVSSAMVADDDDDDDEKIEKSTGEKKQVKEEKDPVLELFESKWLI